MTAEKIYKQTYSLNFDRIVQRFESSSPLLSTRVPFTDGNTNQ